MSIVYMTREITPESLVRIYRALGVSLPGSAAVKISTGEPGGRNFLQPELIRNLVQELMGTIVECNTAYEGRRNIPKLTGRPCGTMGSQPLLPVISWTKRAICPFR